ncbi:hypothetical protein A2625_00685 [candidate division WOR-1 bacterium RIFCSPHIGHO2_01_FULL_53_15]|uniref:GTP 3',8-cyclase n=1 Tax=candidate division WOR-1 bacterium RIFCSPHIGHO2_01_FULL_53_15 TaxID=1802564 RepID=A0A1F4Q3A9_UNCSA|nr:MAG: hypothetical protein A2625_00685 [candidate division WOR-1 bacterium RIFCSPHIGHO2_01_FULL_53_15]OGC12681.1 MAG: hypothetical protein A3D23_02950 [candidate division WOR-1 bacterium RIFCSPHIGHO2_02_FULL_53_26]
MRPLADKFGRAINYLRISVTDRCNLRCAYCMPAEGIALKTHAEILSYEEIVEICKTAVGLGINKIRLTGGEPLVRRDICELVFGIANIPGLQDLALTTNGVHLKALAFNLKKAGLRRVNVSLDSLDPAKYQRITRGGNLSDVLQGIEAALAAGLAPLKINIVLQWGFNDDEVEAFMSFADRLGVKLQFIRQMSLSRGKPAVPADNVCTRPPDCRQCNRVRLTADGKFKPCLFSDLEIDVRIVGAERALRLAVESKPEAGRACYKREMVQIGG